MTSPYAGDSFFAKRLGGEDGPYTVAQLREQSKAGSVRFDTPLKRADGDWFPARELPELFSRKQWLTTLILSVVVGSFGVDRMYLGQVGLGVLKLITCGGFTIWWVIDIALIATDKVTDAEGMPLAH